MDNRVILLDTNVISELMRPCPAPAVLRLACPDARRCVHVQRLRGRDPFWDRPPPAGPPTRRSGRRWPPCSCRGLGDRVLPSTAPAPPAMQSRPRNAREAIGQPVPFPIALIAGTARAGGHRHPQRRRFRALRRAGGQPVGRGLMADPPVPGAAPLPYRPRAASALGHGPRLRPPGARPRDAPRLCEPPARLGGLVPGPRRAARPRRPRPGRQPSGRARRPARLRDAHRPARRDRPGARPAPPPLRPARPGAAQDPAGHRPHATAQGRSARRRRCSPRT